jgi:hypothetical protein
LLFNWFSEASPIIRDIKIIDLESSKDYHQLAECLIALNTGRDYLVLSDVIHYYITMGDYKIKKETEFEVGKSDTEEDLENAGDKVKAGAKAFGKKVADPDRDLESEYQKEKIKEKLD